MTSSRSAAHRSGKLRAFGYAVALTTLLASAGCDVGDRNGGSRILSPGEEVYLAPRPGGNSFACATCHAISEPSADGLRRPGHPIGDAPLRASFKNGELTEFLDAANVCLETWMLVPDAWTDESPDYLLLRDYLLDEAEARALDVEEVVFEIVPPPEMDALEQGDPTLGRELFNRSCVVCHGADGAGTQRAPQITGYGFAIDRVAERIRTSGSETSPIYEGLTGGRMPFWAADRLSDAEVADLAAYVSTSPPPENGQGVPDDDDLSPGEVPPDLPPVINCAATHPRVGQTLSLGTFAHQVAGTVTVIDDCTLRFDDFHYDGQGINVQIYGGLGGDYQGGFSMSRDIRRGTPYEGTTFEVNLPDGYSLDDMDGVSIWCVPVGASFGEGSF